MKELKGKSREGRISWENSRSFPAFSFSSGDEGGLNQFILWGLRVEKGRTEEGRDDGWP